MKEALAEVEAESRSLIVAARAARDLLHREISIGEDTPGHHRDVVGLRLVTSIVAHHDGTPILTCPEVAIGTDTTIAGARPLPAVDH